MNLPGRSKLFDISTAEGLANAIEWQSQHVAQIAQGGYWAVPRSMTVYRINHDRQLAVKLCGLPEPGIQKVFEAMGWRVVDAP